MNSKELRVFYVGVIDDQKEEIKKLKAENERLNVIIKEYEKKLWKGRK